MRTFHLLLTFFAIGLVRGARNRYTPDEVWSVADKQQKESEEQARAVAVLLSQVPPSPPAAPASSRWIESNWKKPDPNEIY
jgi:hypothetical protein